MLNPSLTIRPARAGEGDVLGMIGFEAWAEGEISTAPPVAVDRGRLKSHFIDFCAAEFETVLVAELDGRAVGWASRGNRDNYVSDLWVAPEAQGLGVGRRLLEALESDIAKAGYGTAELETAAVNTGAIRFYERGGYAQIWRGWKYSSGLDQEIEKVRLQKLLGPKED